MSTLYLGLDVGTQGTKGLVLDVGTGTVVARAGRAYELIAGLAPGAAEQHPETWIEAVAAVAAELWAGGVDPSRIAAVGVSGQQHGLVVLDAGGAVIRPAKLWCDTATAAEADALSDELGRTVPTGFTASKVRWLARHEPRAWAGTATVMLPHDYVNFRLTGERTAEAGDASGTGFFDVAGRHWDEAAAAVVDPELPGRLPRLLAAGEPAGVLSADGAALLGLAKGLPVAAGSGDNMCSAVGSGAVRPGVLVLSLGTSGTAFTHADAPTADPAGLIAPFCGAAGGWLPLLCVMNLTGVTEEVRAAFGAADHDVLTAAAEAVPRGCDGVLWAPYLQGERVPDLPRARGALTGLGPGSLRPGVLFRAAMEGTSLNLGWGVRRLLDLGLPVREVRLVGGAARNPLWRRILADVLATSVTPLAEAESAALGAAVLAAWTDRRRRGEAVDVAAVADPCVALGTPPTEPDDEGVRVYADMSARFRELVARLYDVPRD